MVVDRLLSLFCAANLTNLPIILCQRGEVILVPVLLTGIKRSKRRS